MYSVVLAMALSGGAEAPESLFGHGCHGCNGCNGAACQGCNGCHGCHGGHFLGLFHGCHGCHGCNGCNGSSCHGCNGCHGCHGGHFLGLFHGCRGCHGCNGCNGCNGSACDGCTGGATTEGVGSGEKKKEMPKGKEEVRLAPATIVVSLPAEASLTVDGNKTASTSERRTFTTPALETGAAYVYTVQAQIVRDGQNVVETQQVTVRGGQTTEVGFTFSSQGVASR